MCAPALLYCTLLIGFLPLISAESLPSRDEPLPPSTLDDDLLQSDLFLTDLETAIEESTIDDVTPDEIDAFVEEYEEKNEIPPAQRREDDASSDVELERAKRGSDVDKDSKDSSSRRIRTGDTILNIRGALRDAIGDASAAPGPLPSSRVDSFVIRPAQPNTPRPVVTTPPANMGKPPDRGSDRDVVVEPHAPVKIPCDLPNATDVRWYKDNEATSVPGANGWLQLAGAERAHAGRWRCVGRGPRGQERGELRELIIYEPVSAVWLSVDGRRLDANTWVPLQDQAALHVRCTAEGGVPPPVIRWSITGGGEALAPLTQQATNYSIPGIATSEASLIASRQFHGSVLTCRAEQRLPPAREHDEPAQAKLDIHVTYPPSFVISRWPGFGVSLWAGRGAALRCDVDSNPRASPVWVPALLTPDKSSEDPLAEYSSDEGSAVVRFRALRAAHAGWYTCRASYRDRVYSSISYYLNVHEPPEQLAEPVSEEPAAAPAPHSRVDVPLGGSVQLNCPKGSVGCWWRRVLSHNASRWLPAGSSRAHGALGISGALYEEGGEYRCVGARSSDVRALAELKRVTLSVTGSATAKFVSASPVDNGWRLECSACGRGVRVIWFTPGAGAGPPGVSIPADLTPDITHCWRTVITVQDPEERWCVASTNTGGAVAVFPARRQTPPALRALHDSANCHLPSFVIVVLSVMIIGR